MCAEDRSPRRRGERARGGDRGRRQARRLHLAGDGTLTASDLAEALGWYAVPIPGLAVEAAAQLVARLPFAPAEAQWINAIREPVLMDTSRVRQALGWHPRHAARDTLNATVDAARSRGLV